MRQIIAMGVGGFSMEPENLLLDQYIVAQVKKDLPIVCFVPTAIFEKSHHLENRNL